MSELNTALVAGLTALVVAILGFVIALVKNESLKVTIVQRLIMGIRDKNIVSISDLHRHDILLKIKGILSSGEHECTNVITQQEKKYLFKRYLEIICTVYQESIEVMLGKEFASFEESDLKILIVEQTGWRRKEISKRLEALLLTINHDRNKAVNIVDKLEQWRTRECKMIYNNVLNTISSGRFISVEYKLDIVLYQYALGLDFILNNGANSFEKLNGELSDFLNNNKTV